MRIVYEGTRTYAPTATTKYWQEEQEFATFGEAQAYVDVVGSGRVITWVVTPNLPNCLPRERYNSSALDVCNDGVWKGVNIHE